MIQKGAPLLLTALTLAVSCPDSASAQDAKRANLKVGVCGIRIVKPAYDGQSWLRAFNQSAGTVIVLQVEYPSVRLIALDKQRSTLDRFVDDEGTDLLVSEDWYKLREDVPVDPVLLSLQLPASLLFVFSKSCVSCRKLRLLNREPPIQFCKSRLTNCNHRRDE